MNSYLTTFFWVVTITLIALSIVHFVKVMKNDKQDKSADTTKAIVYISGAILLAVLLVYRPFDVSKIKSVFRRKPMAMSTDTAATLVTTSLMSPTSVSV